MKDAAALFACCAAFALVSTAILSPWCPAAELGAAAVLVLMQGIAR